MNHTNPADELEKVIPNQRSVDFFFSKGVFFLKGLNEWTSVSSGFNLVWLVVSNIFYFHPYLAIWEDFQFDEYFSNGLVQPPISC